MEDLAHCLFWCRRYPRLFKANRGRVGTATVIWSVISRCVNVLCEQLLRVLPQPWAVDCTDCRWFGIKERYALCKALQVAHNTRDATVTIVSVPTLVINSKELHCVIKW